jgi:hypothetical protein
VPNPDEKYFLVVPTVYHFASGRDIPKPFLIAAGPDLATRIQERLNRFWVSPDEATQDCGYDIAHQNDPALEFGQERFIIKEPAAPFTEHPDYPCLYNAIVIVHMNGEQMTPAKGYQPSAVTRSQTIDDGDDKDQLEDRLRLAGSFAPLVEWNCTTCQEKVNPRKSLQLWSAPPLFILQIARFTQDCTSKNDRLIEYPNVLDLAKFVIGPQKDTALPYELIGVVRHLGSTIAGGHYAATAWNHPDEKWYIFNDDYCHEATQEDIHSRSAYLLFYERIEQKEHKQ